MTAKAALRFIRGMLAFALRQLHDESAGGAGIGFTNRKLAARIGCRPVQRTNSESTFRVKNPIGFP
jgi:hypothetical protein